MSLTRAIAVVFLALGFALGSVAGVAAATEQAFADPCPMQQGSDCPNCKKDDCTGAMMACAAKCSIPFGAASLPALTKIAQVAGVKTFALSFDSYNPFVTGPAPPIPIA